LVSAVKVKVSESVSQLINHIVLVAKLL